MSDVFYHYLEDCVLMRASPQTPIARCARNVEDIKVFPLHMKEYSFVLISLPPGQWPPGGPAERHSIKQICYRIVQTIDTNQSQPANRRACPYFHFTLSSRASFTPLGTFIVVAGTIINYVFHLCHFILYWERYKNIPKDSKKPSQQTNPFPRP